MKEPPHKEKGTLSLGPEQQGVVFIYVLKNKNTQRTRLGIRRFWGEILVVGCVWDCLCPLAVEELPGIAISPSVSGIRLYTCLSKRGLNSVMCSASHLNVNEDSLWSSQLWVCQCWLPNTPSTLC